MSVRQTRSKAPWAAVGLTDVHTARIHFLIKTSLIIDDTIMARLRVRAAAERRTISELVEAALRRMLEAEEAPPELPELPSFDSGGAGNERVKAATAPLARVMFHPKVDLRFH